jgi:hypothetical protein
LLDLITSGLELVAGKSIKDIDLDLERWGKYSVAYGMERLGKTTLNSAMAFNDTYGILPSILKDYSFAIAFNPCPSALHHHNHYFHRKK